MKCRPHSRGGAGDHRYRAVSVVGNGVQFEYTTISKTGGISKYPKQLLLLSVKTLKWP
jgi:hypothetical protein